jgi:D-alanyl-lipoteichoic acid acyltransferase DltB (MBOAT superfamily)
LEVLLLKKHISNQIQHITKNLPVANIDVSCQFNTDKSLFEKAVYDYFGYFLNDKQQQEQQQQQLQLIPQMISQVNFKFINCLKKIY